MQNLLMPFLQIYVDWINWLQREKGWLCKYLVKGEMDRREEKGGSKRTKEECLRRIVFEEWILPDFSSNSDFPASTSFRTKISMRPPWSRSRILACMLYSTRGCRAQVSTCSTENVMKRGAAKLRWAGWGEWELSDPLYKYTVHVNEPNKTGARSAA